MKKKTKKNKKVIYIYISTFYFCQISDGVNSKKKCGLKKKKKRKRKKKRKKLQTLEIKQKKIENMTFLITH